MRTMNDITKKEYYREKLQEEFLEDKRQEHLMTFSYGNHAEEEF